MVITMDFYDKFMSYGLDKNNKFNLDEVADKIIKDLKLDNKDKMKLIFRSVKQLSYEFYDIVSFFPFKLNLDQ
nr:MAG TPA: hypothetical protein [Caudoviricetes sp.]